MADVVADTKLYQVSVIPHLLGILKEAQSLLDTIQTGLNQYLETKRLFFPRFYFLSNDELLEILSNANSNCAAIQPHLKKWSVQQQNTNAFRCASLMPCSKVPTCLICCVRPCCLFFFVAVCHSF
jgi:dynein heavy chain